MHPNPPKFGLTGKLFFTYPSPLLPGINAPLNVMDKVTIGIFIYKLLLKYITFLGGIGGISLL